MTCDEYDFILVAGPHERGLPPKVREAMKAHCKNCDRHSGKQYHQELISTMVTPDMEVDAQRLVDRINKEQVP